MNQQLFMGAAIVLLSLVGLQFTPRFVLASHMGRKLQARLGESRAVLIARGFLIASLVFGICLASGVINPR